MVKPGDKRTLNDEGKSFSPQKSWCAVEGGRGSNLIHKNTVGSP